MWLASPVSGRWSAPERNVGHFIDPRPFALAPSTPPASVDQAYMPDNSILPKSAASPQTRAQVYAPLS